MIKLPTWDEFLNHPDFDVTRGLCGNTYNIIEVSDSTDDMEFCDFLKSQGLRVNYPIKVGGYLKIKQSYGKSSALYHENEEDYLLYVGMQGALRHNLYNRYIRWLVEKFPENYYL